MQEVIEIRSYQPGDEEEIVELLELVFGGWPKLDLNCDSINHWRWKYVDYPSGNVIVNVGHTHSLVDFVESKFMIVQ